MGRVPENENRDATTTPPDDVAIAETAEVSTVTGATNPELLRKVRSNDKTRANPELTIIMFMSVISAWETLLNVTSFCSIANSGDEFEPRNCVSTFKFIPLLSNVHHFVEINFELEMAL